MSLDPTGIYELLLQVDREDSKPNVLYILIYILNRHFKIIFVFEIIVKYTLTFVIKVCKI